MPSYDRPREADQEQTAAAIRREVLEDLAGLLRGQGFTVNVETYHLAARRAGGRGVEVWCQTRSDDGGRWWFTWAGGIPIVEADRPTDAVVAVKMATRRVATA